MDTLWDIGYYMRGTKLKLPELNGIDNWENFCIPDILKEIRLRSDTLGSARRYLQLLEDNKLKNFFILFGNFL
jgi:hypothetical protein